MGQQKAHLKKLRTLGAIGAEPVIIILILPPRVDLILEKTKLSKTLLLT
jgi:hypothetical protein